MNGIFRLATIGASLVLMCGAGCVSKSTARAQARSAYMAGQQQSLMRAQQQAREPSVAVFGQVRKSIIPWRQGLTVASVLVEAEYYGPDPSEIIVTRNGQQTRIDPKQLIAGEDMPVAVGDAVEIKP